MARHGSPSEAAMVLIDYVEKAETVLNDLARSQLTELVPAKARVAVGKPAEEILQVAGDERVDLIVVGTHGRTGLRHVLLGSVAETMVRTAPCPVFTSRLLPKSHPEPRQGEPWPVALRCWLRHAGHPRHEWGRRFGDARQSSKGHRHVFSAVQTFDGLAACLRSC
jgi:Universal stress protein family